MHKHTINTPLWDVDLFKLVVEWVECVSRILAFIVKNNNTIFFACFIDELDSSHVEI